MQDAQGVQVLHASRNVHEAQHARALHATPIPIHTASDQAPLLGLTGMRSQGS